MKRILFFVVVILSFFGCVKQEKGVVENSIDYGKKVNVKLLSVWDGIMYSPWRAKGVYDNKIWYVALEGPKFYLIFRDFSGKEVKRLNIVRGKGPGEILVPYAVRIKKGKIYIYDSYQFKVAMYDMNLNLFDEFMVTQNGLGVQEFDIFDNNFYFRYYYDALILKTDYTGKMLGKVVFKKKLDPKTYPKKAPHSGVLLADESGIYIGSNTTPYRIEKYNRESLKKEFEIRLKFHKAYKPTQWKAHVGFLGNYMVYSIVSDENYLYVPFGFCVYYKNQGLHGGKVKNRIFVFDKRTGKFVYNIECDKLNNTGFGYKIVGVTKDKIVLYSDAKDVAKGLVSDKKLKEKSYTGWFFILENPVYRK